MIRAIFFDLDGTLLNSQKIIPPSALVAMKKCQESGIRIFLSTARPTSISKALAWSDDIKSLFSGGAYCNGAVRVIDDVCDYCFIPSDVAFKIVTAMKKYPDINLALQMKDNFHAFNNPLPKEHYIPWGLDEESVLSTENCSYVEIIKILIYNGNLIDRFDDLPSELINIISNICGKKAKMYLTDNGTVIQINNISASKYEGVESIRKKLGFDKSEVMVFGDDLNDIEMIKGYENSVAMGNGVDEIKNLAKFVTKSNDEDGIAFAINSLFFCKN